ncbi:glycosyltransferase [Gallicola sp. Sow4_E12]|uniref:glycosyltransferase n=1 Tax=Gallicola sp. Sow4_E12 TaxID=3438785 RepID=UPI003F92DA0B
MKIMVFDVPADSGGALTILNQYYDKAVKDTENEWIFIISTPILKSKMNVKVVNFPWVKKSWFHRLYFDKFVAPKLVKEYKIDEILSLQNTTIQNVNVKQTLYLHQPLPFVEKRYRLTENPKFWIYQNIISRMIFKSIKNADKVIVQTKWMKEACLQKVETDPNKFEIIQPDINIIVNKYYKQEDMINRQFFYPSSALEYKNHEVIVKAVKKLIDQNINNFTVVFTLDGNENPNINRLHKMCKKQNLPIQFIGKINIEDVYDYYSKSILIFPSYIETFGLPMLEASMHKSPILASDCAFSHEILDGYEKVQFFDPFDIEQLYDLMKHIIVGSKC